MSVGRFCVTRRAIWYTKWYQQSKQIPGNDTPEIKLQTWSQSEVFYTSRRVFDLRKAFDSVQGVAKPIGQGLGLRAVFAPWAITIIWYVRSYGRPMIYRTARPDISQQVIPHKTNKDHIILNGCPMLSRTSAFSNNAHLSYNNYRLIQSHNQEDSNCVFELISTIIYSFTYLMDTLINERAIRKHIRTITTGYHFSVKQYNNWRIGDMASYPLDPHL